MTRQEEIADFMRGSYWLHTADQGHVYFTWEELDKYTWGQAVKDLWLAAAKTFENRLARNSMWIIRNETPDVSS